MKHYNAGHVWGRVSRVTDEKADTGTPYLAIEVQCPNDLFGNVKTYGRLWGKKKDRSKLDAFLGHYKQHPGSVYKFEGFFSQYSKGADRLSNYTFFSWHPVDGGEFRAAFVLRGEVTASEKTPHGGKIFLHVVREGKDDHKDVEEDFEVYTLDSQLIDGLEDGVVLKTKGVMRYKEAGDFFGDREASGPVLPYIMDMKVAEEPEPEMEGEAF